MTKIPKGIVISTSTYSAPFFKDFMKSLKDHEMRYPMHISFEGVTRPMGSFEIGAIKQGCELFDEFIFLHDTVVVKDPALFEKLFAIPGHVALTAGFYHYFGKYVSSDMPPFPEVRDKEEAIKHELSWFTKPYSVFEPQLPHSSKEIVERHGRQNMKVENEFITKYKGTYR